MFTGLIEHMGVVRLRERHPAGERLMVDPRGWTHKPAAGDSIAINGCCLTVAQDPATTNAMLIFDVVPESLARTTLGDLAPGAAVNLEHAATASTLLGGHIVQGHIDGVGLVTDIQANNEHRVRIQPPHELMEYIAPKGSICIDGVSLTVASIQQASFELALIPTTLEKTTLRNLAANARVNIECDPIGKQVVHWCRHYMSRPGGPTA